MPIVRLTKLSERLPLEAVFSGRTAAWLHGLDVPPCDPVEVTLPGLSCRSRLAGCVVRRSDVAETEIELFQGLRATGGCRTTADLGRRLELTEAVVFLDTSLHRRLTSLAQLRCWVDAHSWYRGIRSPRRALQFADGRAEVRWRLGFACFWSYRAYRHRTFRCRFTTAQVFSSDGPTSTIPTLGWPSNTTVGPIAAASWRTTGGRTGCSRPRSLAPLHGLRCPADAGRGGGPGRAGAG